MRISPLDILFSKYIKLKAGEKCEYCGATNKQLHCHHGVVGRRYVNTRYEEDNCACLCVGCHYLLGDFPKINNDFFIKRIGTKRAEELEIIARTYRKMDKNRREEIKANLQKKVKLLEG